MTLLTIEIGDTVSVRSEDGSGPWIDEIVIGITANSVLIDGGEIDLSERQYWEDNDMMKVTKN